MKYFKRNMSRNIMDKERRVMKTCPPTFPARDVFTVKSHGTDTPSATKRVYLFRS